MKKANTTTTFKKFPNLLYFAEEMFRNEDDQTCVNLTIKEIKVWRVDTAKKLKDDEENLGFEWIRKTILPHHKYITAFREQERFVQGYLAGYLDRGKQFLEALGGPQNTTQ